MTLNIGVCIPQMRPYQKSVDTAPRPQDRRHGCRHPPPPAHPNHSAKWHFERMSAGVVAALRSGLLKISSVFRVLSVVLRSWGPRGLLLFTSWLGDGRRRSGLNESPHRYPAQLRRDCAS